MVKVAQYEQHNCGEAACLSGLGRRIPENLMSTTLYQKFRKHENE
jgi:hypothetical protein